MENIIKNKWFYEITTITSHSDSMKGKDPEFISKKYKEFHVRFPFKRIIFNEETLFNIVITVSSILKRNFY